MLVCGGNLAFLYNWKFLLNQLECSKWTNKNDLDLFVNDIFNYFDVKRRKDPVT